MKRRILQAMLWGFVLVCLTGAVEAQAEHKTVPKVTPSQVFKVPTSGKIVDIDYRPEFDEWWVKCREDEGWAVYCYDRNANKWSKVVFSVGKSQPEPKKPEKDVQLERPKVAPDVKKEEPKEGAAPVQEEPKPEEQKTKPEETKPPSVTKGEQQEKKGKDDKRQWWNPLELLKKGGNIIRVPLSPEGSKKDGNP